MPENNLRQAWCLRARLFLRRAVPPWAYAVLIDTESASGACGVRCLVPARCARCLNEQFAQTSSSDRGSIGRLRVALRTWGESESGLNERLDDIIHDLDAEGNPTCSCRRMGEPSKFG